jgi:ClpP class serine protease
MHRVVDALGKVFVETVARNRGVATETVLADFGKGGILIGQDAVSAGLADGIGTFEGVLSELAASVRHHPRGVANGVTMTDTTFTAEQRAAFAADAVKADRERVAALRAAAPGFLTPDAELAAAIDGGVAVQAFVMDQSPKAAARRDAAAKAAADAKAAETARSVEALKKDEDEAAAAAAAAAPDADAATADNLVAGITAFIPADRRAAK